MTHSSHGAYGFAACSFRKVSLAQPLSYAIRIRLLCELMELQPIAD